MLFSGSCVNVVFGDGRCVLIGVIDLLVCFEVLKLGTSLLNKYTCEETTVLLCTLCTSCLRFSSF